MEHDIVFLCETMTRNMIDAPGFTVFIGNNSTTTSNRSGTALLVKHNIAEFIYDIDRSVNDQIWFRLSFVPNVIFGGCYIHPSDSSYYDEQCFSNILGKRLEHPERDCILFGDLNSRLGPAIQTLVERDQFMKYRVIDPVSNPNHNGNKLLGILRDCDLLIVNNLSFRDKHFYGHLTYRMRSRWISELDLFVVSRGVIDAVTEIAVNTSPNIPSNHAPVSLSVSCGQLKSTPVGRLLGRANQLGEHAVLYSTMPAPPGDDRPRRRRPLNRDRIGLNEFQRKSDLIDPSEFLNMDIDSSIDYFCNSMYDAARESPVTCNDDDAVLHDNRWRNILNSKDDKLLWRSIDWNGVLNNDTLQRPRDIEFKDHLETLLNPEGISELNPSEYVSDIYVPVLDDTIDPIEVSYVLDKQLNVNKSPGIDCLVPVLFKHLPERWIPILTVILNNVFIQGYPVRWAYSRLNMLFKKGDILNCNNYRGISVINCTAKIYDYVLFNRLSQWFTPHREQAGAQPKKKLHRTYFALLLICVLRKDGNSL